MPNFAVKNCDMEKIIINQEARRELKKKYGDVNVCRALNFSVNSQMAKEIRHLAMNHYNGCIINL